MRVTNQMIAEITTWGTRESQGPTDEVHDQAGSRKRHPFSSEEAGTASQTLSLHASIQASLASLETARIIQAWMKATEIALKGLANLGNQALSKAQAEFATKQVARTREATAFEIGAILQQAIDLGNSQHKGQYIFSGLKTGSLPFTLNEGLCDRVTYHGDKGQIHRNLGTGQRVTLNLDGEATLIPFFSSLISVQAAFSANDPAALSTAIADLRSALDTLNLKRADTYSRHRQVEALIAQCEWMVRMLHRFLAQKEDAKLEEVIQSLRQQENVYNATLAVINRTLAAVNQIELFR